MEYTIDFKGIELSYIKEGEGDSLIFLHGYLEAKEVWREFSPRFTDKYSVICIDFPGHGASGLFGRVHEMADLASVVNTVMLHENIDQTVLIGHSMGGYVTLSFAEMFPEKLLGYCLFHSSCFADDEEKKLNRDREISLIRCGKKTQIIRTNIPKCFADSNIEPMDAKVQELKKIALKASDDGIVALIRGMKNRKDHTETLRRTTPLIIWGEGDNYIPEEVFKKLIDISPEASALVLKNSGHIGFIEEPDLTYFELLNYLNSLK